MMQRKEKITVTAYVFVNIIIVLGIYMYFFHVPPHEKMQTTASHLIEQVELYKSIKGRLPDNLRDLGINGDSYEPEYFSIATPINYDKTGEGSYSVWYDTGFLGRREYNSASGEWIVKEE